MVTYVSAFFSGSVDPFWPHFILIGLTVLGGIAVGAGIITESEKWSVATVLVVIGVATEAIFTIILFRFDEGISLAQQEKIIFLESEIAPRRIDPKDCPDISKSVKSFSGSTVRVATYALDIDGALLGWQIADCLELSHSLNIDREFASILPIGAFGVGAFVSGSDESLVSSIRAALRANVRVLDGTGIFPPNQLTYRPGALTNPAATVVVGVKPPIDMK
jgi:hypothetical protein